MDFHHLHLILNHVPVIGTTIGVVLLTVSMIRKSNDLKWISLVLMLAVAVITIPVFTTGEPAEERIEDAAGVSEATIDRHEDTALPAFVMMELTGAAALICLLLLWRNSRLAKWNLGGLLAMSLITTGLMARTANLGGQIRHPEIRSVENAGQSPKTDRKHDNDDDDEH